MIANKLGGDIAVKSKWGQGTEFTIVIATEKIEENGCQVQRIKNPNEGRYTKIERKIEIEVKQDQSSPVRDVRFLQ